MTSLVINGWTEYVELQHSDLPDLILIGEEHHGKDGQCSKSSKSISYKEFLKTHLKEDTLLIVEEYTKRHQPQRYEPTILTDLRVLPPVYAEQAPLLFLQQCLQLKSTKEIVEELDTDALFRHRLEQTYLFFNYVPTWFEQLDPSSSLFHGLLQQLEPFKQQVALEALPRLLNIHMISLIDDDPDSIACNPGDCIPMFLRFLLALKTRTLNHNLKVSHDDLVSMFLFAALCLSDAYTLLIYLYHNQRTVCVLGGMHVKHINQCLQSFGWQSNPKTLVEKKQFRCLQLSNVE